MVAFLLSRMNHGQVFYTDRVSVGQVLAAWHGFKGTCDADGQDGHLQFLAEDGECLLESSEVAVFGACPFWEDDNVLALFDYFGQFQDGVLEVMLLHEDDVVVLCQVFQDGVLNVFFRGVEVAVPECVVVQAGDTDGPVEEALVVGGEDELTACRDVLLAQYIEPVVQSQECLEQGGKRNEACLCGGQYEGGGVFGNDVLPVCIFDFRACLVLCDVFSNFSDAAE